MIQLFINFVSIKIHQMSHSGIHEMQTEFIQGKNEFCLPFVNSVNIYLSFVNRTTYVKNYYNCSTK